MLLEFSVGNYRSFFQPVTLSLLATALRDDPELDRQSIFQAGGLSLLRSAAVYGANASGKSNFVRAVMLMRHLVLNSATRLQSGEKLNIDRFRLDIAARNQPAYFQIIFLLGEKRYRYGFEADDERVHSEWLYHAARRETRLFVRDGQDFDISISLKREAASVEERTRPNALFISTLAQFNSPTGTALLQWFRTQLKGLSGLNDDGYAGYTMRRTETDDIFRQRVRETIRLADIGITDISVKSLPIDYVDIPKEVRQMLKDIAAKEGKPETELTIQRADAQHLLFNGEQHVGYETFEMEDESEGTKKFFALLGPVFDALEGGKALVVDEMEARLHPLLTREIIRLFNTPQSNPKNAQLLFAAHDAGLLGENLLRRDQIWFTQKNHYGATELYSLAEVKERKDASYYRNYLAGRYGGVPLLSGLRLYIEQELANGANP